LIRSPAQAVTGSKQRHGLEQVRFARAVIADQHDGTRVELELGLGVVAEVSKLQLADEQPVGVRACFLARHCQ